MRKSQSSIVCRKRDETYSIDEAAGTVTFQLECLFRVPKDNTEFVDRLYLPACTEATPPVAILGLPLKHPNLTLTEVSIDDQPVGPRDIKLNEIGTRSYLLNGTKVAKPLHDLVFVIPVGRELRAGDSCRLKARGTLANSFPNLKNCESIAIDIPYQTRGIHVRIAPANLKRRIEKPTRSAVIEAYNNIAGEFDTRETLVQYRGYKFGDGRAEWTSESTLLGYRYFLYFRLG